MAAALDSQYVKELTRLTKAKADLAQIKLKIQKGLLIRKVDAEKYWGNQISNVKAKLLSLPAKIAPQAEGLSAQQIEQIIKGEIYTALTEFAEGLNDSQ